MTVLRRSSTRPSRASSVDGDENRDDEGGGPGDDAVAGEPVAEAPGEVHAFRFLHQHRSSIGLSYRDLALVLVLSVLTGLGQAAILMVLVRLVTAATTGTEVIGGSIGPLEVDALTRSQLLLVGIGLTLLLFVGEVILSKVLASSGARAQRIAQCRILEAYSGASFDAQTSMPRGDTQAIVLGLTVTASSQVGNLGQGISALASFVTLVVTAVLLSPVAAAVVLAGVGIVIALTRPMRTLLQRFAREKVAAYRVLANSVLDRLQLSRELRSFGVEQSADAEIAGEVRDFSRSEGRVRVVSRLSSVIYRISTFLLVFGMLALIQTTGARNLAALTGSLLMLLRSLSYGQAVQGYHQSFIEAMPAMEQMVAEEDRLESSAEPMSGSIPAADHIRSLEWKGVSFAYRSGGTILHDVDLSLSVGDFVALIGRSGAGKSTMMNLLLRLREPTSGSIIAAGVPVEQISLGWWRQRVAHVPQEPLLRSGSIADAIRFHRDISDADVRLAARRAHIAEEIESWPMGYDTAVGQLGDQMSGGQRQRLAIARALAGRPDLLLLDEPTSALDPRSEQLIAETLEEIREEMIIVAIAHRLRTVEHANRVILLEDGRVVANPSGDLASIREFLGDPAGG